jgi:hypothetical protein
VERNAGLLADGPRITQVLLPGTTPQVGQFILEPDLEIKGTDVPVPGLFYQSQGNGTVNAA